MINIVEKPYTLHLSLLPAMQHNPSVTTSPWSRFKNAVVWNIFAQTYPYSFHIIDFNLAVTQFSKPQQTVGSQFDMEQRQPGWRRCYKEMGRIWQVLTKVHVFLVCFLVTVSVRNNREKRDETIQHNKMVYWCFLYVALMTLLDHEAAWEKKTCEVVKSTYTFQNILSKCLIEINTAFF